MDSTQATSGCPQFQLQQPTIIQSSSPLNTTPHHAVHASGSQATGYIGGATGGAVGGAVALPMHPVAGPSTSQNQPQHQDVSIYEKLQTERESDEENMMRYQNISSVNVSCAWIDFIL